MRIVLTRQVVKTCPFKPETDVGELVITIDGDAPELHSLASQVDELTTSPISHEEFTRKVAALLPPGSGVVTRWQTGPWAVEVQEGVLLRHDLH